MIDVRLLLGLRRDPSLDVEMAARLVLGRFIGGGFVGAALLTSVAGSTAHRSASTVLYLPGFAVAVGVLALACYRWLGLVVVQLLAALAALLIAYLVYDARSSYALLFIASACVIAFNFPWRWVVVQTGWMLTCLAVAIGLSSPQDNLVEAWVLLSGVLVLIVALIVLLQRRAVQWATRDMEGKAILDAFFATAPLGVCLLDRELRFVRVNDTYASWSNTTADDHVGKGVNDLQPGIREQIEEPLRRLLVTGEPLVGLETITQDRHYRASHYPIRDASGDITMIAAIIDDVTTSRVTEDRLEQLLVQEQAARFELERARWKLTAQNRQLAAQATTDSLTKLANRAAFEERLADAVAHARRMNMCVGVLYIDLDGFKAVNDRYGHAAGDQLLAVLARRLTMHRRGNDLIARVGGDEFLVLLPDLEITTARATVDSVAARIREAIAAPVALEDAEVRVSSSVGTSLYPADAETAADLVAAADRAMYRLKRAA